MCWQEVEAIKLKLWAMEQAQRTESLRAQGQMGKEEGAGAILVQQQLLSAQTGRSQQDPFPGLVGPRVLGHTALSPFPAV